jgi:methylase of polypeptide subunit release factors
MPGACGQTGRVEPHQLVTGGDAPLGEKVRDRLAKALDDRLAGMPVHRILGFREFYGLPLGLSPATLEPRPDTGNADRCRAAAGSGKGLRQRVPARLPTWG